MTAPNESNWAVDLRGVEKTYPNGVQALRGVDVRVGQGEIFGLLGPNGAGKSTLVKIMMTVVRAGRADGRVLGRPLGDRATMKRIGYLPEAHRFPGYLTGAQVLDYYAALALVPRGERRRRAPRLLERVGMAEWADTKISKYSKGMLQRLGIAQALMNDPDLVVLDEPTDGLDPIGRRDVRELLTTLRTEGKTVFLNSHLLSELEMVCNRVVMLIAGAVARQGTLDELVKHTQEYRIAAHGDLAALRSEIEKLGGAIIDGAVAVRGDDRAATNAMIDLLRSRGMLIESVSPHRLTLEDVFVQAIGGAAAGRVIPMARPVHK